jgi:hypothetical protein
VVDWVERAVEFDSGSYGTLRLPLKGTLQHTETFSIVVSSAAILGFHRNPYLGFARLLPWFKFFTLRHSES